MLKGRLDGKRAVVTGGGSGIGLASVRRFVAEGADVVIWDVDAARVSEAVEELSASGGVVDGAVVDISSPTSVAAAAERTVDALGGIDVLMNNAGVLDGYAPLLDADEALWDRILGVNLKGPYLVTRALLPSMLAGGGGSIINTASVAGVVAGGGGIAYTSAKHGLIGFTRQMAYDYGGQGIRVNAILPGAVATGMTNTMIDEADPAVMAAINSVPAGRHAQPEEIAAMALYLACDESSFSHGALYTVDGGHTAR